MEIPKRPLPTVAPKPVLRPGIKIKPKAPVGDVKDVVPETTPSMHPSMKRSGDKIESNDVKKHSKGAPDEAIAGDSLPSGGGLEGLGGYGSNSDQE